MWIVSTVVLLMIVICLLAYTKRQREGAIEARRADHIKEAFLRNVSHEIKVPLQALDELANVFSQDGLYLSKTEKQNLSRQVRYNADQIRTLLDEVMVFTVSDATGHELSSDSFSPNELCRRCLEANMFSIYHRQAVKLNFKRELSDEFFVKSDRHLVELILNKLILNACRFTEQGEITVGCNISEHTGQLTIFVADTGAGIPENRRSKIFDWFEEPNDTLDDAELDLSICQKVAQELGGAVYMDEHYLRSGTRMLLVLPLRKKF